MTLSALISRVILVGAVATFALRAPTVKLGIFQRAGATAGESEITVRIQPVDLTLGAYQGTLRFNPGSFVIVSSTTPRGDGTRVVNVADSAKGLVRFAGFTVSGFTSQDVLTLIVRSTRKLEDVNLIAELQVAGDLNGISVPKDRMIPARGITADPGKD